MEQVMSIIFLKILNGIDSKPLLKNLLFGCFKAVALALKIDNSLILRAEFLHLNEGSAYSCGLLYWLIRAKLKIAIPRYNIHHLIASEHEKIALTKLCEMVKSDYYAIKQRHLVQQTDTSNEGLLEYVKNRIEPFLIKKSKEKAKANVLFNKKLALEALECCQIFFDRILNKKCFLVSGTLLGFVREQDFVDGDYDMDLGFFESEISKDQVYKKLKESPYFNNVYIKPYIIKAKHKNGVAIDFFVHYQEGRHIWHGSNIHRWYNSNFFLQKANFKGIECYIPSQPERYLEENYGKWEYPVSYWNYSFDTPNQQFPKNIETLFYLTDSIVEQFDENITGSDDRYVVTRALNSLKETFGMDLTHYLPSQTPHPVLDDLKGKKVVITFGTFDLFHIGHLNIIKRAVLLGDRLVVGVSSDSLNYSKKGEYPTYSENDRMSIVKAVDGVEQVFLEESLELKRNYILNYRASVLVMGDDWKGKFDEFNDICRVVYLPRTELVSTTTAKNKIISKHLKKL
ncbi:MAG: adenylyltransferase/cytidyltransferase family protein [Methylococcales bacterium]